MIVLKADEKNVNDILDIEKRCFSNPFEKKSVEYEISKNPFSNVYIIFEKKEAVAYIDYWITFDSSTICRIATIPEFRKKGYAQKLLNDMFANLIDKKVSTITLEVRASNLEAISLYEKNGFVKINTKKSYYDDGEDAVYMAKGVW